MRFRKTFKTALTTAAAVSGVMASTVMTSPAFAADEVLIGAGDIASCRFWPNTRHDQETATLLKNNPGNIFTAGDNSQDTGTAADYRDCYGGSSTWGQADLFARTRPAPGNHDYMSGDNSAHNNAAYYYNYFGSKAGSVGAGYYSYDLGNWHIVVLNSNCDKIPTGCGTTSDQMSWLQADLDSSTKPCTAAYWHAPLVSRGALHPGLNTQMQPLFSKLYEFKADIVMNGHNHVYERYGQLNASGNAASDGIRQFVVGTGGTRADSFTTNTYSFAQAEVSHSGLYGVLKLSLGSNGYNWQFLTTGNTVADSSPQTVSCHAKPQ